jgi:uncharacterized membrane protein YphA (DoxX/SURF4 family)
MKISVNIVRVFVGLLFIFSGLVKANDPLGTAYKMEEYFEVWNGDLAGATFFLKGLLTGLFHFMNKHTLFLSVFMNAFEIIAGAALLLGWRMRLFSWLLLLLMIFFTILTGYTYRTGQPTNCGCFGDCIKITSEFSFYKDVVLSVLILFILFAQKHIKPLWKPTLNTAAMFLVTLFSFGLQWYALKYLPPVDCLPYKAGNNITEKMKIPANAEPDSIVMTFVYEKEGRTVEFTGDKFPEDFNDSVYIFKNRYDKVVRKGSNNEPPVKGFKLTTITNEDFTATVLNKPYAILLFEEKIISAKPKWESSFNGIQKAAMDKNIPVYIITSSADEYSKKRKTDLPVFNCDFTTIRTAARAIPTLYILQKGTVTGKWGSPDFNKAFRKINELPAQPKPPTLDELFYDIKTIADSTLSTIDKLLDAGKEALDTSKTRLDDIFKMKDSLARNQ